MDDANIYLRYFHGGPRGLSEILPPSITGALSCAFYGGEAARVCRRDRVYVTTDYTMAVAVASLLPRGTVYEVAPINPAADPDCRMEGVSFEAERARIVREIRPTGKTLKMARKVMTAP